MPEYAVQVHQLGKQYRIGTPRAAYGTLRDSLADAMRAPLRSLRKQRGAQAVQPDDSSFWALREVSFNVRPGEVIGVIGKNGAGKSTLLKILSRITEPTSGYAAMYGRAGTLLEVGTGFHPELSGRENILLNGAILGMPRSEIVRKFDEIVAFAEVEKFIDTPVKHYSSGMYLRLAFAVAAHLEPEILIIDEVLAVGDLAFQRKCLGKIGEIARDGRTVLFVSHNMQAISQLTQRCIVLENGTRSFDGPTTEAVRRYSASQLPDGERAAAYIAPPQHPPNYIAWARVHSSSGAGVQRWGEPLTFEFALTVAEPQVSMCFSFQVMNESQQPICHFWLFDGDLPFRREPGTFMLRCAVPHARLYLGDYTLTTWLSERRGDTLYEKLTDICPFSVSMEDIYRPEYDWVAGTCTYLEDQQWSVRAALPADTSATPAR